MGGNLIRHYKWREGVGSVTKRTWMHNYYWCGKETNSIGTHEFVDLCHRIRADALLTINFMSDGLEDFRKTKLGENRVGTIEEAADWVSYCNDPDEQTRKKDLLIVSLNDLN